MPNHFPPVCCFARLHHHKNDTYPYGAHHLFHICFLLLLFVQVSELSIAKLDIFSIQTKNLVLFIASTLFSYIEFSAHNVLCANVSLMLKTNRDFFKS